MLARTVLSTADGGHIVWLELAVSYSLVQSVRVVGTRRRANPLRILSVRILSDAELPRLFSRRSAGCLREQIGLHCNAYSTSDVENDQNRAGFAITRTRLADERDAGVALMGSLEALVELLSVHPQLPGGASLTAGACHSVGECPPERKRLCR